MQSSIQMLTKAIIVDMASRLLSDVGISPEFSSVLAKKFVESEDERFSNLHKFFNSNCGRCKMSPYTCSYLTSLPIDSQAVVDTGIANGQIEACPMFEPIDGE